MPGVKMHVSAVTDVGRARFNNEDAFTIRDLATGEKIEESGIQQAIDVLDHGVLLALSDGMGGAEAGEVASALVLESLHAALASDTPDKGAIHEQLEAAVLRANEQVLEAARTENRKGMGATLTALFVRGDEAYIAEVGDSRAYLLRNGRLRQITRDQSLVQLLVDQGVMSPEEARTSTNKNVILQAVGLSPDVRVAIARLRLRRGDRVLLCSDGVSNAISDAELLQIVAQSDPRNACQTMIALANDRGGDDNQTAIVADLVGDGLPLPDEFETVTETYEVLQAFEVGTSSSEEPPRRRRATTPDRPAMAANAELAEGEAEPATVAPARAPTPTPEPEPATAGRPSSEPSHDGLPRQVAHPAAPTTARIGLVIAIGVIIAALTAIALRLVV